MNNPSPYNYSHNVSTAEIEIVLAEWLSAMSDFHTYYKILTICINKSTSEQILTSDGNLRVGQCSINELRDLMSMMKSELGKLFQHVDQINTIGDDSSRVDYKTIVGHTTVLQQLNKEVKEHLYLVALPAS
ncbi:hypothetical protein [Spirosoma fluviale]|uniref:Uncharacterized protein n=1 Tax=Spirosoma fluviale TaxID=1597977 RepID=A0A286G3Y6_9BACT|nr:hypothetical protein [Spirosoma fluviale]SOD90251.1 hypothetical protein SAMN06269250_3352 [Spirosoma fluviale]